MSLPEVVLWSKLRSGRLGGLLFRRQHPLGIYILDFYCPAARLAVEVDGAGHFHPERAAHDARRYAWLAGQGVNVLRFQARLILDDDSICGVLVSIEEAALIKTGRAQ